MLSPQILARQAEGSPGVPSTPERDIEDNTAQLLAVVGTLYGLALLAVLLRVWVRTRILKAFGMIALWHKPRRQTQTDHKDRSGRLAYDYSNSMRSHDVGHAVGMQADTSFCIAPQHSMPRLHCILNTPRPGKARRNPPVSPSMGTPYVRVALLLLDFRHPRIQLHQALHCGLLASPDTAN